MDETLLYRTPTFVIALLLFVSMLVLTAVAYRLGERRAASVGNPDAADIAPVDGAVAALLALMLALSFTLASDRFEARQALTVKESNAIGTAYLRCNLLEPDDRRFCQEQLRAYVEHRISFFEDYRHGERYRAALEGSERIHRELWARAAEAVRREKAFPALGLLLQALNAVIDVHAERVASFRYHVPQPITVLLLGLALAWAWFLGYALGLKGRRRATAVVVFVILVTLVTAATLDLDRPRRGLITLRAGEASLVDLRRSMQVQ